MTRSQWELPLTCDELDRLIEWANHECESDAEQYASWSAFTEPEDRDLRLKLERVRREHFQRGRVA